MESRHASGPAVNRGARAVLLLLGFVALMVLVMAGIGAWWWSHNGREWKAGFDGGIKEGMAFGKGTDQDGCLAAAFERHRTQPPEAQIGVRNASFLNGCLSVAKPVPNFCDGVPMGWNALAAQRWSERRCADKGIAGNFCPTTLGAVIQVCDQKKIGIRR